MAGNPIQPQTSGHSVPDTIRKAGLSWSGLLPRASLLLACLAAFFLIVTIISAIIPTRRIQAMSINDTPAVPVGEIYDGRRLEISITAARNDLMGITMLAATYERVLTQGELAASLIDDAGRIAAAVTIAAGDIHDNQALSILYPLLPDSAGRRYVLRLETQGIDRSHAITFWANDRAVADVHVSLDGERLSVTPVFTVSYLVDKHPFTWDASLATAVCLTLAAAAYRRRQTGQKPGQKPGQENRA